MTQNDSQGLFRTAEQVDTETGSIPVEFNRWQRKVTILVPAAVTKERHDPSSSTIVPTAVRVLTRRVLTTLVSSLDSQSQRLTKQHQDSRFLLQVLDTGCQLQLLSRALKLSNCGYSCWRFK